MGPTVAVEYGAVKDEKGKFARLAVLLGLADADHARGKCEHLWMACATREEAKIGLPVWLVEQVLGEAGPQALVDAELADFARTRGDTKMRRLVMHKAADHCDWKRRNRDQASKGGKSRAKDASRNAGKFTSDNQPGSLAENQPSSSSSSSSSPDPEDQKLSPARDPAVPPAVPVPHQQVAGDHLATRGKIPQTETGTDFPVSGFGASSEVKKSETPSPERAGHPPPNGAPQSPTVQDSRIVTDEPAEYDPEDPRARGRLAERIYRAVSDARIAVAAELGLPAQLPFPPIAPSTSAGSFRDLRDRVREEGANAQVVCWRIVANLQAQAREDKSLEWLGEKAFREGSWRSAREWMPAAHRPRSGPKSSAARANSDPKIGRIEPPPASAFRGGIQKL